MPYIILFVLVLLLIYGPQLWVNYVLNKYKTHLPGMPGTGSELALHLLKLYDLQQVEVKEVEEGQNFYSPEDNYVGLSPDIFHGKSLTAVAAATHEVGHALQFNRHEPVSQLRVKYLVKVDSIRRYGLLIMIVISIIGPLAGAAYVLKFSLIIGAVTMLASVGMYLAVLPEEWDASFNKALPILVKGAYVPPVYLPAIRRILTACALTYVAAALMDVLNLWRWIIYLR